MKRLTIGTQEVIVASKEMSALGPGSVYYVTARVTIVKPYAKGHVRLQLICGPIMLQYVLVAKSGLVIIPSVQLHLPGDTPYRLTMTAQLIGARRRVAILSPEISWMEHRR